MGVAVFVGSLELLILFLVPVVLLAVVVGVVLVTTARSEATLTSEVAAARRHAVTTSAVAALLMLGTPVLLGLFLGATAVVGLGALPLMTSARALAVTPLLGALAGLCALLVGELTWPRPTGSSRTALLQDRSLRTLLEGAWVRTAAVTTVLTAAALVTAGVLADGSGQAIRHTPTRRRRDRRPVPGLVLRRAAAHRAGALRARRRPGAACRAPPLGRGHRGRRDRQPAAPCLGRAGLPGDHRRRSGHARPGPVLRWCRRASGLRRRGVAHRGHGADGGRATRGAGRPRGARAPGARLPATPAYVASPTPSVPMGSA